MFVSNNFSHVISRGGKVPLHLFKIRHLLRSDKNRQKDKMKSIMFIIHISGAVKGRIKSQCQKEYQKLIWW